MNNFFRDNIVSLIGLAITCGGLLVHVGVTKAELAATKAELVEFKIETRAKIRDVESDTKQTLEKINDTLNRLDKQVAIVVNHIERQKP